MSHPSSRHEWTLPAHHPVFAGHFPGTPIVPGVLLLDTLIQVLAQAGMTDARLEIRSAKFLSPARPGETLTVQHTPAAGGMIRFEIFAGARKIAMGDVAALTAQP